MQLERSSPPRAWARLASPNAAELRSSAESEAHHPQHTTYSILYTMHLARNTADQNEETDEYEEGVGGERRGTTLRFASKF